MPRMAGRREGDWRMNIWEKKKDRERESKRAVLTLSGLIDWLATLDQTTMHQSLSASQSRQAWGKKKKKEKNLHTVWIQLPCTGFDFCNHSWPSALSRPKPNQCAIYFICYKKNNEISASQGKKKIYDVLWQQEIWNMFPAKQLLWGHN